MARLDPKHDAAWKALSCRIEEGDTVPVYNLDVAEAATFLVGKEALLVHDNTLPDLRERPYDRLDGPLAAVATP